MIAPWVTLPQRDGTGTSRVTPARMRPRRNHSHGRGLVGCRTELTNCLTRIDPRRVANSLAGTAH
jgi:hypothetical protein